MGIHFERGRQLFDMQRFREAAAEASQEISFAPESAWGYGFRGASWLHLKMLDEAGDDIRRAIELDPEEPYFFYLLSCFHASQGNPHDAITAIDSAIQIEPQSEYLAHRAELLNKSNRFDEAIDAANAALQLEPTLENAHIARAIALIRLKRFGEAETPLLTALEINPESAQAHMLLGSISLIDKPPEVAADHLQEARRLSPVTHNPRKGLRFAYGRLIWPFSMLERPRRRYLTLSRRSRWLVDATLTTALTAVLATTRSSLENPTPIAVVIFLLVVNILAIAAFLDLHALFAAAFIKRKYLDLRTRSLVWPTVKHLYVWSCIHLCIISSFGLFLSLLPLFAVSTFFAVLNWPLTTALLSKRQVMAWIVRGLLLASAAACFIADFTWVVPPWNLAVAWIVLVAISAIVNKLFCWSAQPMPSQVQPTYNS